MPSTALRHASPALPSPDLQDYLRRILTARVYDVATRTALQEATSLSDQLGHRLFLKREDTQPVASFKLRGAYNRISQLDAASLERGVITASAGNHAQGVAWSAARLGVRATIVLPQTAPRVKVDATRRFGGPTVDVVLAGESYTDAHAHALELQRRLGMTYVPAFDDPDVIAGQGTVAMEILGQHQGDLDAIFVPIGGGSLAAGIASYVKAVRPQVKVIGVQTRDSCAMARSIDAGHRVTLSEVGLFSDGTAVKLVGEETFRLCQAYLDDMLLVDTDEVCMAIHDIYQDTRTLMEPAGALAVAGAKQYAKRLASQGGTFVAITSGANLNIDRIRFIAERAEAGGAREALFAVSIPEERGSFLHFCQLIGQRSVTEFNYRMGSDDRARLFVGLQIEDRREAGELKAVFEGAGFPTVDLSGDELSREHIRHMVGGRSLAANDERLFRFEFPERPGALMAFLRSMAPEWNISLFHYRNQGADYSSTLVGIQVPATDGPALDRFLDGLGYPCREETANPAYRLFLREQDSSNCEVGR
ncbi:threonine ammonia-lyase, biosynthetic [Rothia nasimurium]|uniref:L-threonine dehydratase n=1 Tax=Luteibacter anthropi TaxID=564369 RepID=A0A7X5U7M6_9GAMM|nr:threonine ammonia-lyase, biosynthetic [Luteibacter anthropi]NII05385.1 threonine ammonia-lyase, biosynthetic [Luteibacter anthropi]